jgi:aminoglycoside 6'-N-acetyltransferase
MESLRGERVVLEPPRHEHAERLRELRSSAEVARWWNPPDEGWPLEAEPQLEKLVILADGELAGFIQFWEESDPDMRHADVDIFLGAEHQDRGLGTDAMRTVLRHLTEERGHHRITLGTSPANSRAIHVYERLGFRRVGVLRRAQRSHVTGEWEDELLMEYVLE